MRSVMVECQQQGLESRRYCHQYQNLDLMVHAQKNAKACLASSQVSLKGFSIFRVESYNKSDAFVLEKYLKNRLKRFLSLTG